MQPDRRLDDLLDAYGRDEPFDLGRPLPTTREACADEMMELDAIIGAIDGQIKAAFAAGNPDPAWLRRAIGAASLHKARRNRVNTHMGFLKHGLQVRVERAFMNAAMARLPPDTVKAIFDDAAKQEPSLFRESAA